MLDRPQLGSDDLTAREMQILQLLTQGLPNKAIAREIANSERTIETYLRSLRRKLGAANRTHLAALAVGLRMVCIVEPLG